MFHKTASVTTLGVLDVTDGQFRVTAAADETPRSYFLDGARKLDVRDLLTRVANTYAVSANPADYFFEVIRANTTNCPNENNDGFHQDELLRFDTKLGMAVYRTYAGKPHHVNHKTENPKKSRGLIIDAHYNADSPALDVCPTCDVRTAERANRDRTGLHCKCGALVKDEFVEILVGIDAKKDPLFAEGVRKGQLKSGSMGCNCLSTSCNVCGHVAYSKPEFCDHIRSGNKGTLWTRKGSAWVKTSKDDVAREMKKRKLAFVPRDFCYATSDSGFEIRKAYEYCNWVVFDEYSRVDQPADPKAEQIEILKAASVTEPSSEHESLAVETEMLIRAAEARKEVMTRAAQFRPAPGVGHMEQDAVTIALDPDQQDPIIIQPPGQMPGQQMQPGAPGQPTNIDQYTENETVPGEQPQGPNQDMDMGELGVLPVPPGASAPRRRSNKMRKFEAAYRKWIVQVSERGNARLLTPDRSPVLVFKAEKTEDRNAYGKEVVAHLLEHGLVATAKKYNAHFSPRFAQVVQNGLDDMKEFADKYMHDSVLESPMNDMQGDVRGEPPANTRVNDGDDMEPEVRGAPPKSTDEDGAMDHKREDMGIDNVTKEDNTDMRNKRQPVNIAKDDVLSGEIHDHKEPLRRKSDVEPRVAQAKQAEFETCKDCGKPKFGEHACMASKDEDESATKAAGKKLLQAQRLEKVATAKLKKAEAAAAEAKAEASEFVRTAQMGAVTAFCRAMRVAAARQSADLEQAPLKLAAEAVLSEPRTIGKDAATGEPIVFNGLDPELTRYLVAQLYSIGHPDHLEQLIKRASDLMKMGDQYLIDAEADLRNLSVPLPAITQGRTAEFDEETLRAAQLRREASQGNLSITPSPSDNGPEVTGHNKRAAIRGVLGGTVVAAARGRLGLN